jgi:two-component system sensor histidine kinase KdpD
MPDTRPNPDELLVQVQAEEAQAKRGLLRIFFGYAAGVGKTYTMLETARREAQQGREVVLGYIEPHARPETQALMEGLESIPPKEIEYRSVTLREFDVDAALARHPDLILVDELAHTNAEGSRHEKRWQDVQELLAAGINVWTTLNVQHIESLNDVIGQITGIVVRETLPDRVFDMADGLELVDITPEELLERLKAGKIYLPEQAQRALLSFFQRSHLTALRELSLRQAARRIHTEVETARRQRAAIQPWATSDRLLVCVGPSPTTARVIRTAKRMASALDAPWLAVSIDRGESSTNSAAQQQIAEHFRLAERLGGETVTLSGQDIPSTILDYARSRNVTKILIGKTHERSWQRWLTGTLVDELLDNSGAIDVYVIHGQGETKDPAVTTKTSKQNEWHSYLFAVILMIAVVCANLALTWLRITDTEANTVMLFLAAVAWVAYRCDRGPAILASILAVLLFDFFFVPPFNTFAVSDAKYVVTFAVMLTIGVLISTLTSRLRKQIESTRLRERRTASLYELGKQLSSVYGGVFLVGATASKIAEMVGGEVVIYLRQGGGSPEVAFGQGSSITQHPVSLPAATWVIEHDQIAGVGTNTLPNAVALFLPVVGSQQAHGAIAIQAPHPQRLLEPDTRRLLEACANQLALALERDQLAIDAANARVQAEAEQVRSNLLSSVSHDLKTPLAAIAGASSSLLGATHFDEITRRQLLETVSDEASRLNRLLENILQMSKLDAGAAPPNKQWHVLEELVGSALHRVQAGLAQHHVKVELATDLPLLFVDGLLVEQVFVNLLENAARYTPAGSTVSVRASLDGAMMRITVSDNGPGIPAGSEERVFDKFYRATPLADGGRGSGLGLAICRAIVKLHGGSIKASSAPGGGAEFVIQLPLAKDSPKVVVE